MTAIDIARNAGIVTPGMSLSSVIKWAMAATFERIRATGLAPRRDGFEFARMIAPFDGTAAARAAAMSEWAQNAAPDIAAIAASITDPKSTQTD